MTELSHAPVFGERRARSMQAEGPARSEASKRDRFVVLFDESFEPLYRYLNRLSGDHDLASELAQEAFVRLYGRRSLPDDPRAWLFTVATNLFRNTKTKRGNRARLLTLQRGLWAHSDPVRAPDEESEAEEARRRVRLALEALKDREKSLLLLAAEGYSYREISAILGLREGSVGTFLRRAKEVFRAAYKEAPNAP